MSLMRRLPLLLLLGLCQTGHAEESARPTPAWCIDGAVTLSDGMCAYEPVAADAYDVSESSTLVIFLHSLVRADSDWQWEQQKLLMRTADALHFAVLMPRGRRGIGPGRDPRTLAWPGSPATQELYEAAVLAEWDTARAALEARRKKPFERVLIFGFSNGAYYATTLAVRGRYPADGYGIFAGGSGSKYNRILASRSEQRSPVFVGYGTKDPAHADMQSLVRMLSDLRWRYRVKTAPIGHWVSDAQLQAAVRFLTHFEPSDDGP